MSVIAERRLKQFQQKFGKAMVEFATHAALPVVLNSELVHLLRINFFYSDTSISYLTEAEFLLSSFCREIGEDLYEIEPAMRTVLLQKLYQQHPKHIKEIAALLWQYTKRYTPWRTRNGLQNAQLLTALNFLDVQKASEWFQEVESLDKALSPEDREWFVAMKSKIESEQQLQRSEKSSTPKVTHHEKASQKHEEESKLWADGKIDFFWFPNFVAESMKGRFASRDAEHRNRHSQPEIGNEKEYQSSRFLRLFMLRLGCF